jgi:hypothetical protein
MNLFSAPLDLKPSVRLFLAVAIIGIAPRLHAGASNKNGNPYGNGTFFQTTGTFSAVVRGQNLSGTILFSTGVSTNAVSTNSGGSSVVVFGGNTYMGNCAGMWNPSSGTITGQIWGGQNFSGTNTSTIYPEIYNTNSYPVAINVVSNVVIPPTSGTVSAGGVVIPGSPGTNYTVTNTIYVEPTGTNYLQDGVYMNGSFDGNVQNSYPNQTFTASGTIIQQQLAQYSASQLGVNPPIPGTNGSTEGSLPTQVSSVTIPITVQGIRVADTYTSFNTINNQSNVPYSTTYYTMTNIPSQQGGL